MAKAFRRAEREAAKEHDRKAIEQAGLRVQRRSPVFAPLWLEPPKPEDLDDRPRLQRERDCYVCKQPFAKVHRYYDSMCEPCGDFNYAKREQTRGPERPVRADHRRAREDRLPGIAQTSARRARMSSSRHAFRSMPPTATRRSRISLRIASVCRSTGWICATRRASNCSRDFLASGCRASTTFSTTPARRCVGRRGSFNTCWRGKRNRSPRFRQTCDACSQVMTSCCRMLEVRARRRSIARQRSTAPRGASAQRRPLAAPLPGRGLPRR